MRIDKFKVTNHKCFDDPKEITLGPHLNVIIGRNNAGKTALLEALSLNFASRPHRSLSAYNRRDIPVNQTSVIDLQVTVRVDDFRNVQNQIFIPLPSPQSDFAKSIGYEKFQDPESHRRFSEWFFVQAEHHYRLQLVRTNASDQWRPREEATTVDYPPEKTQQGISSAFLSWEKGEGRLTSSPGVHPDLGQTFGPRLKESIQVFLPPGITGHAFQIKQGPIAPDASNLGPVLFQLGQRTAALTRFKQRVREVAPEVLDITLEGNQQNPIPKIWLHDPMTERDDLAVPLQECGQGLKYIFAMMYFLFAEEVSHVILIDEIQSFLHPGALRKLFEKFHDQHLHQFILSSNSPLVVTSAQPDIVVMVTRGDHASDLDVISGDAVAGQKAMLHDLGASLADVFGADGVMWVEGPTESECFELILTRFETPLRGIVFLPLRATGDFEGAAADLVCDVYKRLTTVGALVPTRLAFVFDDEGRGPEKKDKIRRQLDGRGFFLPTRMYENYLLHPEAIASYWGKFGINVSTREIGQRIEEILADRDDGRYFPSGCPDVPNICVHAANVLQALFSQFGNAAISYKDYKREIAVHMTQWLLEHDRTQFTPLVEFLRTVIEDLRR